MNKFMGEWCNADLDYKNLKNNLHNTPELKKACTDRNNARNRDIYSRARASGNLVGITDLEIKFEKEESKLSFEESNDLDSTSDDTDKTTDSPEDS